ncbi:MAG: hypothetical protein RL338_1703 [Chloroflexota bacterium]
MPNADPRVALQAGERQSRIEPGHGELAGYILLPGDTDRTTGIDERLDTFELARRHRRFGTVTGDVVTGERSGRAEAACVGTGSESPLILAGMTAGSAIVRRSAGDRRSGV